MDNKNTKVYTKSAWAKKFNLKPDDITYLIRTGKLSVKKSELMGFKEGVEDSEHNRIESRKSAGRKRKAKNSSKKVLINEKDALPLPQQIKRNEK